MTGQQAQVARLMKQGYGMAQAWRMVKGGKVKARKGKGKGRKSRSRSRRRSRR